MPVIEITDLSAPELAPYARLTEAQLRARQAPEKGLFIAEGVKVIAHALDAGCEAVSLLMPRRHAEGKARALIGRCGAPVYTADEALLSTMFSPFAKGESPQGEGVSQFSILISQFPIP